MSRELHASLSDQDYRFICDYVYNIAGIVLTEGKREMVYRRLTRIIRDRKLGSFAHYCELLREHPEQERDYFINAITTNLTSFFRENHHFEFLTKHELPRLQKLATGHTKKRLRVWSCASSTGEEPYSIAITLLESFKSQLANWDAKILATDIDSNVLAHCNAGVYDEKKVEELPEALLKKYFHKGTGANSNKVKVDAKLQQLITFKQLNLLHQWPMKGPFDVIFCRNVIIYFDKKTQHELFDRFYHLLKPGGVLILGHSENLGSFQQYFANEGRTIFRKPEMVPTLI